MNESEFKSFKEEYPEENKHLIVTNNIKSKNAHGEMSHVWLTNFVTKSAYPDHGIVTFDEADRRVTNLTHWKYA